MELSEIEHKIACGEMSAAQVFTQMKQHIDSLGSEKKKEVRRGQIITLKSHGRVVFERLDFYMGECTAQVKGIDNPGKYYIRPEILEKEGFIIIDS